MRLINVNTLGLEEFFGDDWKSMPVAREKTGFQKIELARNHAISQDIEYLWVDTNCINKDSSAELAEAINSMFAWYRDAEICYAYLSGVSEAEDWSWNENDPPSWTSMLAPSPRNFRNAREFCPARDESSRPVPYSMTNFGLSIQLPIIRLAKMPRSDVWLRPFEYIAVLSAGTTDGHLVGIPLEKTPTLDTYKVVRDCPRPISLCWKNRLSLKTDGVTATHLDIFVPSREPDSSGQESRVTSFDTKNSLGEYAVLLLIPVPPDSSSSFDGISFEGVDAIPRHRKSRAGFIRMRRFQIAGPPHEASRLCMEGFHATEAHGALVRISFKPTTRGKSTMTLLFGVLVSEAGDKRWFHRILEHSRQGDGESDFHFTFRSLETLLAEAAAGWQDPSRLSSEACHAVSETRLDQSSGKLTVTLGPEFLVEANYLKTSTRAAHFIIRDQG
ncbi:het domain-containing protein [Colletotrichum kahawae]|uniref:Het domain-containing protein n=1 Tax=Colletotrichum kahawae TaxID=34407 RepID=A0AAE0DDS0_COLKA|nr:het domain-containing protein [Colletotrichum kahawae]